MMEELTQGWVDFQRLLLSPQGLLDQYTDNRAC